MEKIAAENLPAQSHRHFQGNNGGFRTAQIQPDEHIMSVLPVVYKTEVSGIKTEIIPPVFAFRPDPADFIEIRIQKDLFINIDGSVYSTKIESFTHKRVYDVIVSKKYLSPSDKILVIDDFLANGCAVDGLIDIINGSGATLCGVGILIEKGFQDGGKRLRARGVRVESLAIVDSMNDETGEIVFRH